MTRRDQLFARFAQDAQSKNQNFQSALKDKDSAFHYTKSILCDIIPQLTDKQRIDDIHTNIVRSMAHIEHGTPLCDLIIDRWKDLIATEIDPSFDSLEDFEQDLTEYLSGHVESQRVTLTPDFLEGTQRAIVATLAPHYLLVTQADLDNLKLLLSLEQYDLFKEAILHHRINIMDSLMTKKLSIDDWNKN